MSDGLKTNPQQSPESKPLSSDDEIIEDVWPEDFWPDTEGCAE